MSVDEELVARALSAENVQRYLDGLIVGEPEPGTLARRVFDNGECKYEIGVANGLHLAQRSLSMGGSRP